MKMCDVRCAECGHSYEMLVRGDGRLGACRSCAADAVTLVPFDDVPVKSHVIGDDIPGGIVMRHGICWPDGTPRRYDSKSAIRAEERIRGVRRMEEQVPVVNEEVERSLAKHRSQAPRIVAIPASLGPEDEARRKAAWRAAATPEELAILAEQDQQPERIVLAGNPALEATRALVQRAVAQAHTEGRI